MKQPIDKTKIFIERAKKIHGNKYDYSKVEYKYAREKVCIICPTHGEFWQTPNHHLNGSGCPKCANKNKTKEEWIESFEKTHGKKYNYSKSDFENRDEKGRICIICPTHGEFWQKPSKHLGGRGCEKCGGTKKMTNEEYIKKCKEKHKNRCTYEKTKYINSATPIIVTCKKHGDFEVNPRTHLNHYGCPKCNKFSNTKTEVFIEKANKIHCGKYDYSKINLKNLHSIIRIVCPIHGDFEQRADHHLEGCGCEICSESKLEKNIKNILINESINFEQHKRIGFLGRQHLDFYLPKYNIGIECQGEQHYEAIEYFGGEKAFIKQKTRDKIKLQLCEKHGVKIIYCDKTTEPKKLLTEIYETTNKTKGGES